MNKVVKTVFLTREMGNGYVEIIDEPKPPNEILEKDIEIDILHDDIWSYKKLQQLFERLSEKYKLDKNCFYLDLRARLFTRSIMLSAGNKNPFYKEELKQYKKRLKDYQKLKKEHLKKEEKKSADGYYEYEIISKLKQNGPLSPQSLENTGDKKWNTCRRQAIQRLINKNLVFVNDDLKLQLVKK